MSELRKANTERAYFITLTVVGWIDIFTRKEYCEKILNNLEFCQKHRSLEIYGYVIMPSHIHLVVRRNDGLLSDLIRDFKSFNAKEIIKAIEENPHESRREWLLHMFKYFAKHQRQNSRYQLWQKTNRPIELWSSSVIDQKIDYIHNNPVEAGIVLTPESYFYSSANLSSRIEVLRA